MPINPQNAAVYTDFKGLAQLKSEARGDRQAALGKVSQQFEAIFTQMMLKSMRAATSSFGNGILDSDQSNAYRDMFDQQLALTFSNRGHGLGIAKVLQRQLSPHPPKAAEPAKASAGINIEPATLAIPVSKANAKLVMNSIANAIGPATSSSSTPIASAIPSATTFALKGGDIPGRISALADQALAAVSPYANKVAHSVDQAATAAHAFVAGLPSDPADFIRKLAPFAQEAAQKIGVSARAILAQAALETGWGKHLPQQTNGQSSFNLFGLKASSTWNGQRSNVSTLEFEGGVAVRRQASFRAYDSVAQSFSDYANLLSSSPRYAAALGHGEDIAAFAKALQSAGYATDPTYAQKLRSIADSPQMRDAIEFLKNSPAAPTS